MRAWQRTVRSALAAAVVVASLSTSGSVCEAGAPPPPSFSDLLIQNTTPFDIGVLVTFWPTQEGNRSAFDTADQVILGRLRKGTSVRVSLGRDVPSWPNGKWGISSMHVSAAYLRGTQIYALPEDQAKVELVAGARLQGSGGWPPNQPPIAYGYAGYTSTFLSAPTDYVPTLKFAADPQYVVSADLRARWAWDTTVATTVAPAPSDTSPSDGNTKATGVFVAFPSNPSGCPCPYNP